MEINVVVESFMCSQGQAFLSSFCFVLLDLLSGCQNKLKLNCLGGKPCKFSWRSEGRNTLTQIISPVLTPRLLFIDC